MQRPAGCGLKLADHPCNPVGELFGGDLLTQPFNQQWKRKRPRPLEFDLNQRSRTQAGKCLAQPGDLKLLLQHL